MLRRVPLVVAFVCFAVALPQVTSAQTPRTRVFTSSHDFLSDAELTRGVVVVQPGSDVVRAPVRRLSSEDSSLRLPLVVDQASLPNLVRPNVTVDSRFAGHTSAAITDGKLLGLSGVPGTVWVSAETGEQHWVDLEFAGGARTVNQVNVVWGAWRPTRFKVQVVDPRGWLSDATGWIDASAPGLTLIPLASVSTTRVRIVQDAAGGAGSPLDPPGSPRVNLMSVDELSVLLGFGPVLEHPVAVDSSYTDYAASLIADGDTREGSSAEYWTETWVSADSSTQHWVEARFGTPKRVAQAEIHWGRWGSARFKVQHWDGAAFVDTSTSASGWLDGGGGQAVSRVGFAPVTTTRLRVLQDSNGGAPPPGDPRVGLMSVAELLARSAETFSRSAVQASADSSYDGYAPGAAFDLVRTNACAPSDCDGPGLLWVSAETSAPHWLELRLGHVMHVGDVTLDWGAWGSNSAVLQYWNGASWSDGWIGSADSNESLTISLAVWTDRLRVFQAAGAGAGRPADGFVRPNLMSIGEILIDGHRLTGTYISAPTRLDDPLAQITLTATQTNAAPPQAVAYSVSSDDGATWAPVTSGVPAVTPPGTIVRWRADMTSAGTVSPEIQQVQLAMIGQPREISSTLWRGAHTGAVSVGVDDRLTTLGKPGEPLLAAGYYGTYFLQDAAPSSFMLDFPGMSYTYATFLPLGHELANHSESHSCRYSPPDGESPVALVGEFTRKQNQIDALYSERGRVQSLAWPCGNYDLAKGSVGQRFFVSARGFRHGDPNGEDSCGGPESYHCALPGGEPQELLEEPTPRNFMNLRGIAADAFRSPSGALVDVKETVAWAQNEGNWLNLVYHYFNGASPYHGEIAEMASHDLWVAPQGEVARYVKLRDSFAAPYGLATPTTREFRIQTTLTNDDVPLLNHVRAGHPPSEWVERVFFGGVTAKVWSPPVRGTPFRVRVWNNGVAFAPSEIEGNPYLIFETPLERAAAPIRVEWLDTPSSDDDGDTVPNALDNCHWTPNPAQDDAAGVGIATPNGVGGACECGDLSDDGAVDAADVALLRARLADPAGTAVSAQGLAKCSVIDLGAAACDVVDLVVVRRRLSTHPLLPGLADACLAALPH